jgi:putative transferase (TIGR04331 family)
MLQPSVDALCDVIEHVTGRSADRNRVEYVSLIWLMHLCERLAVNPDDASGGGSINRDSFMNGGPTRRSKILSRVSSFGAPVTVVEPYIKTHFGKEIRAVLRARGLLKWGVTPMPSLVQYSQSEKRKVALGLIASKASSEAELLRSAILLAAPSGLVEQHHELAQWGEQNVDERSQVLFTANAHQASIVFRHVAFAHRRRGSTIAVHQHGGGYGIDEYHLGEEHDLFFADVFYTWGWTREDRGTKVMPLPTAFPNVSGAEPGKHMLLMSAPIASHFYRFHSFLLPTHSARVVDETVSLCRELSDGTDLRIRSSSADAFPMNRLTESRAAIREDDLRESGSIAASRAQLVIHNYLGTSWLETLALNIPTVCFYEPKMYRPREAARPFIDALTRVGIIHHSGKEAARFINGLNGNPSGWWNSPEVQEARHAFVARYANFSNNWLDAWTTEFDRLLAER